MNFYSLDMDSLSSLKTAVLDRIQSARGASTASQGSVAQFVSQRADSVLGENQQAGGMAGPSAPTANQLNSYDLKLKTKNSEPLTGTDKAGRLKDLNGFSQRDDDNMNTTNDKERCAATAMTAAAYQADGRQGLLKLVQASENYTNNHGGEAGDDFTAIKAKLQSNQPLTKGDLSLIADRVHGSLKYSDAQGGGRDGQGVSQGGVSNFLKSPEASEYKSMLQSNGSSIEPVSAAGNGKFDHWVARVGTGNGAPAIYDPESIRGKDGNLNQVVTDEAGRARYDNSTRQVRVPGTN